MEKIVLKVEGMSCAHCERAVGEAVSALPGVSQAQVDLAGGTVTITYDPAAAAPAQMREAIEEAGYDVPA